MIRRNSYHYTKIHVLFCAGCTGFIVIMTENGAENCALIQNLFFVLTMVEN